MPKYGVCRSGTERYVTVFLLCRSGTERYVTVFLLCRSGTERYVTVFHVANGQIPTFAFKHKCPLLFLECMVFNNLPVLFFIVTFAF